MSNDSIVQLIEARRHYYTNPHPPIMAAEWRLLDMVVSGPILMLALQAWLFLLGAAALLRRVTSPRRAAALAVALLLFPPVITTMAVIWKDAQMAGYLLAGAALLLSDRAWRRGLGLGLVTAGCAFRHNGFAAGVPLVIVLFELRLGMRWYQRYAISLIAAVAMVYVAFGFNRLITDEDIPISPAAIDIVGTLVYTTERSDAELGEMLRGAPLQVHENFQMKARQVFSLRNMFWIDKGENSMFHPVQNEAERQALRRAWLAVISSDWDAYLSYHRDAFFELIGLTDDDAWGAVYNLYLEDPPSQAPALDHNASWSALQGQLGHYFGLTARHTPLFRPYVYIAVALLLLVLACRDRVTFALLGSGLTYELSFFPVASTPDFRYSQWMIATTCLVAMLLFIQRWRQRPRAV